MNNKPRKIELQFNRMESKRKKLIALLRTLPGEKYLQQPDSQSWSAGQVANHLYLSERFSLEYLKKKMSYPDTIPKFHIKTWLGMFMYKIFMGRVKVKAPTQINMWDQQALELNELDKQWEMLRKELMTFVYEKYPEFKSHLVYKNPFAGRLTMRQMLIFFNDHLDHHTKQINRILHKINSGM